VISNGKIINGYGNLSVPLEPATTGQAITKVLGTRGWRKELELKPHPSLEALFSYDSLPDLELHPEHIPMVVPPLPWVSFHSGAYLIRGSNLIKSSDKHSYGLDYLFVSVSIKELSPVLDLLHQQSAIPWTVNKLVLEVASQLFLDNSDKELLIKTCIPLHPDNIKQPKLSKDL